MNKKHTCKQRIELLKLENEDMVPAIKTDFWNLDLKTDNHIDSRWGIVHDDGYYNHPINFCPFCGLNLI